MVEDAVKSQIGKVVAFVLTPILLPLAGIVANWAQDALGLDLNGADLTAYVVAVVAGVALGAWQWLRNRSEWEKAVLLTRQVHEAGAAYTGTATTGVTVSPPGATQIP
jgi:hypothetical protein